jgi:hypothetical protein
VSCARRTASATTLLQRAVWEAGKRPPSFTRPRRQPMTPMPLIMKAIRERLSAKW